MTPDQIKAMLGPDSTLAREYDDLPQGVPLKRLVTARILIELINAPTPGLWNGLMERAEGRVPLAVDFTALTMSPEQIEARIQAIYERARERIQAVDMPALPDPGTDGV